MFEVGVRLNECFLAAADLVLSAAGAQGALGSESLSCRGVRGRSSTVRFLRTCNCCVRWFVCRVGIAAGCKDDEGWI